MSEVTIKIVPVEGEEGAIETSVVFDPPLPKVVSFDELEAYQLSAFLVLEALQNNSDEFEITDMENAVMH